MFIYAIGTDSKQKIGVSSNVEKRLATLQTSNSETLNIQYCFEVDDDIAYRFEKYIHREQNHKRLRGEWFDISKEEIINTMTYYEIMRESLVIW